MGMTNQEFFDRAVVHVMQQTERSSRSEETRFPATCLYAGFNGNACAIGCFLPRDVATELDKQALQIEHIMSSRKLPAEKFVVALFDGVDKMLLGHVQRWHDTEKLRDQHAKDKLWLEAEKIAAMFSLKLPARP
jgi:hypothetical protein